MSDGESTVSEGLEAMELDTEEQPATHLPDALCSAAHMGLCTPVAQFLRANGDVNMLDQCTEGTMLIAAAACGHLELLDLLLAAGARINLADAFGSTALAAACCSLQHQPMRSRLAGDVKPSSQRDAVVLRLLAAAATPDQQDSLGLSATM